MADDTTTPTPAPEAPPSPAPEPTPPPEAAPAMVPKEKLDDALTRLRAYEDTLRALNPQPQQHQPAQPAGDPLAAIAQRLGTTPDEARQWANFLTPYFESMAQPYVQALATLHDRYDALNAQSTIPDYRDYTDAIERERQGRAQRNEYLSHTDAYHLVKSRELPKLLERERSRLLEEQRSRADQARAAGDDLSTTQTSGPSPTKQRGAVTADDFARMSLAEKEAFLADKTF